MKYSWLTLANSITLIRVLLTPIIGYFLYTSDWGLAAVLLFFAVLSDFLDGFLARYLHQQSRLGAFLDHSADKFLMLVIFGVFLVAPTPGMPAWFCWLVVIKELVILIGTGVLLRMKRLLHPAPLTNGKWLMAGQMVLVLAYVAAQLLHAHVPVCVFLLVTGMVIINALRYATVGLKLLRGAC